jgi:hypothetical protein
VNPIVLGQEHHRGPGRGFDRVLPRRRFTGIRPYSMLLARPAQLA